MTIHIAMVVVLAVMGVTSCPAAESFAGLPMPKDVFTIAVAPCADGTPAYFTPESLLKALPDMQNVSDVLLPVGGPWQNGVIVCRDKQVLFWRSCGDWLIGIEGTNGTCFYTRSREAEPNKDSKQDVAR